MEHKSPLMASEVESVLLECGNDVDAVINNLSKLCLGTAEGNSGIAEESRDEVNVDEGKMEGDGFASASRNQLDVNNLHANGAEWVDSFVGEMMVATNVDDAKTRAARMLEVLEKSIIARANVDATNALRKENLMLKEQNRVLTMEKNCFKNAFRIVHGRCSDYENQKQEILHLKQLVSQYNDQIKTLEVNNYAMAMHLKQAQQSNSLIGSFPLDLY